jgi:F-type H+-transporting ATPase subunit delta
MASNRDTAYAKALLSVAAAEGDLSVVQDEVFTLARTIAGNDELSATLSDTQVPAARRAQIIEDLLGGRASSTTVAILAMIVINGRVRDLPAIAEELAALGAAEGGKQVAIVRSAIELTSDQRSRLATALQASVGQPVEVRVVIDPSIMGGLVAQVGDTVIDGSVRRRLEQLKQAI